jgi:hypothetical protein
MRLSRRQSLASRRGRCRAAGRVAHPTRLLRIPSSPAAPAAQEEPMLADGGGTGESGAAAKRRRFLHCPIFPIADTPRVPEAAR